jgi:hypothetical protein
VRYRSGTIENSTIRSQSPSPNHILKVYILRLGLLFEPDMVIFSPMHKTLSRFLTLFYSTDNDYDYSKRKHTQSQRD